MPLFCTRIFVEGRQNTVFGQFVTANDGIKISARALRCDIPTKIFLEAFPSTIPLSISRMNKHSFRIVNKLVDIKYSATHPVSYLSVSPSLRIGPTNVQRKLWAGPASVLRYSSVGRTTVIYSGRRGFNCYPNESRVGASIWLGLTVRWMLGFVDMHACIQTCRRTYMHA